MKKTIEECTVLIPYLIAENAIQDAIKEKYPNCANDSICEVVSALTDTLCEKAERLFSENKLFRKQITKGGGDRDSLLAFMQHWTFALIGKSRIQVFKYCTQTNTFIKI